MLQMFCYFVISRGWRYKRRGIILAFDVLLWGITFGYSMLCWRLPRHKSFCSKENSSRLLPTAGVNIAKGTRSRNQIQPKINYKWCTSFKANSLNKEASLLREELQFNIKEFYFENLYNHNILQNFIFSGQIWITCVDAKWWWFFGFKLKNTSMW